jgi:hypothetical protein
MRRRAWIKDIEDQAQDFIGAIIRERAASIHLQLT